MSAWGALCKSCVEIVLTSGYLIFEFIGVSCENMVDKCSQKEHVKQPNLVIYGSTAVVSSRCGTMVKFWCKTISFRCPNCQSTVLKMYHNTAKTKVKAKRITRFPTCSPSDAEDTSYMTTTCRFPEITTMEIENVTIVPIDYESNAYATRRHINDQHFVRDLHRFD